MEERIGRKKYRIYAMDFETHNDDESIALAETGVWLGCLLDETSKPSDPGCYYSSVEELLDKLDALTKKDAHSKKESSICVYDFHLAFEWSFILPVLLKLGYTYKDDITDDDEKVFNSITTKSVSSVWSAEIKIHKGKSHIFLRDLNKMFPGSLRSLAKSFGLETQKGEIDYKINRRHGWVVTDEERNYCFKDVRIIMEILMKMDKKKDKDFWNSTSAASYAMRKMIRTAWPNANKPMEKFREIYPILGEEETKFLRKGFSGGLVYATDNWMFKDINQPILHIDAHNMHPSQAYFHKFPCGKGTYFEGKPDTTGSRMSCCRIRISYTGVKLHSVIQLIGMKTAQDYELTVWDFEIPTMMKCYENLEIEYVDGYSYATRFFPWRQFYMTNYVMRLKARKIGDAFEVMYRKGLNNSSFGKLCEKPHNVVFVNTINNNGVIDSDIVPVDKEDIKTGARYTYLPAGSAIPAFSRVCLIETALLFGWRKVIYFDTDSIFVIDDAESEAVWDTLPKEDMLGNWGREPDISRGEFDAPKRYKIMEDDKQSPTVHAAGINPSLFEEVMWEDIDLVEGKYLVQKGYRVKGGTIIDRQLEEMQVQEKYERVYRRNTEDED